MPAKAASRTRHQSTACPEEQTGISRTVIRMDSTRRRCSSRRGMCSGSRAPRPNARPSLRGPVEGEAHFILDVALHRRRHVGGRCRSCGKRWEQPSRDAKRQVDSLSHDHPQRPDAFIPPSHRYRLAQEQQAGNAMLGRCSSSTPARPGNTIHRTRHLREACRMRRRPTPPLPAPSLRRRDART
jgi:hypothetical protein